MPAGAPRHKSLLLAESVWLRIKSCHTMQSPCKGCTVVGLSVCLKGRTHDACMHCHRIGLMEINQRTTSKASLQMSLLRLCMGFHSSCGAEPKKVKAWAPGVPQCSLRG